ncbi:hypothetical protein ABB02_01633 [Clostridiaceae bacterium JG1575]|nr:hypothetical protein ABB02_01633 [Clostridiaceae bacterium JG1575]
MPTIFIIFIIFIGISAALNGAKSANQGKGELSYKDGNFHWNRNGSSQNSAEQSSRKSSTSNTGGRFYEMMKRSVYESLDETTKVEFEERFGKPEKTQANRPMAYNKNTTERRRPERSGSEGSSFSDHREARSAMRAETTESKLLWARNREQMSHINRKFREEIARQHAENRRMMKEVQNINR